MWSMVGQEAVLNEIVGTANYTTSQISRFSALNPAGSLNAAVQAGVSREEMDAWALRSHQRAIAAIDAGSFDATATDLFLVMILAAVFLGGPGQPYGAMLGAVIIGVATEVSAGLPFFQADYKYVIAFLALLIMLGVRPTGLLGERT